MTKHFLPEPGATELTGTDYIRAVDGATMRYDGIGSFVAKPGSFIAKPVSEDTGPVIGEMESFDDAIESPENVSDEYAYGEFQKLFGNRGGGSTIEEKRPDYIRPVFVATPKDASEPHCIDKFSLWVGSESIDLSLPAGFSPKDRGALNLPTNST
jgi:hypothetical protein